MSAIQDSSGIWAIKESDSKYEKCRNITEEIYKRIDITFQIKQLETAAQSDVSEHSDQIDSNELSNETDLFACDKTSISSSEPEGAKHPPKFISINNNNNEEKPKPVCKRPRKRFRKRVKKRQSKHRSDSDASSDEALPLSRMVEPALLPVVRLVDVLDTDLKPKPQPADKKPSKKDVPVQPVVATKEIVKPTPAKDTPKEKGEKHCTMCSLTFKGERGLRRHMTMSHISTPEDERNTKPA